MNYYFKFYRYFVPIAAALFALAQPMWRRIKSTFRLLIHLVRSHFALIW